MKDYYKILGVDKKASDKEIKKSFRNLSKEHHPDKGGDEDKFKEIAEAYNTLSDKDKKRKYDMGGQMPQGFGDHFRQQRKQSGSSIRITIQMTLEDIDTGITKKIKYKHSDPCSSCGGSGGSLKTCHRCHGSGMFTKTVRTPMGTMQTVTTCPYCGGQGEEIDINCESCNGSGVESIDDTYTLEIPPGLSEGDTMIVSGKGNYIRGGVHGDLLIRITESQHKDFTRDGGDLLYKLKLTYPEITMGGDFEVPTLKNKIKITVKELSIPGNKMRVGGKGMASQLNGKGNLIIELVVKEIDNLDAETKEILKKLQDKFDKVKK